MTPLVVRPPLAVLTLYSLFIRLPKPVYRRLLPYSGGQKWKGQCTLLLDSQGDTGEGTTVRQPRSAVLAFKQWKYYILRTVGVEPATSRGYLYRGSSTDI